MLATLRHVDAEKAAFTGVVGLVGESIELGAFDYGHGRSTDRSAMIQANSKKILTSIRAPVPRRVPGVFGGTCADSRGRSWGK